MVSDLPPDGVGDVVRDSLILEFGAVHAHHQHVPVGSMCFLDGLEVRQDVEAVHAAVGEEVLQ